MKKIIILGITLFLTCGCDSNLSCEKTAKYDDMDIDINVSSEFHNGNITKLEVNNKANLKGDYENYSEVFSKTIDDYLKNLDNKNIEVQSNGLEFTAKVTSFDKRISKFALERSLVKEGFKCE